MTYFVGGDLWWGMQAVLKSKNAQSAWELIVKFMHSKIKCRSSPQGLTNPLTGSPGQFKFFAGQVKYFLACPENCIGYIPKYTGQVLCQVDQILICQALFTFCYHSSGSSEMSILVFLT